nr:hypothetical protein [Tanacetum cinerariifolium]
MERECAKLRGELLSNEMERKRYSEKDTHVINCLKQTVSELQSKLTAHQDTISVLTQQKDAQIKLYKTQEDKDIEKVIDLENKVKASVHNSTDPAPTRQTMASVQNSTDPAPTCQKMASVQISSDPAPTCQTMALEHNSLSPGSNCQENVSHRDKTGTTSNELDLLFSPMFDELLNGSTKVVSKSSAVSAADAPNHRQQPLVPLNTHTTHVPTCQNPPITTSVISSKNINQAEPHVENAQVAADEFINTFSTPIQNQGETFVKYAYFLLTLSV